MFLNNLFYCIFIRFINQLITNMLHTFIIIRYKPLEQYIDLNSCIFILKHTYLNSMFVEM